MKLTVFGATGGIGGHTVRQALDAGHTVTAVVRDRTRLVVADHAALRVVTVPDLSDPERVEPALLGADAALSGIGPRSRGDAGVTTPATRAILGALEATGVRRFVLVSAMPVGPIPDAEGVLGRRVVYPLLRRLLRTVYDDLAAVEADLRRGATEWTVVRPPKLTNGPLTRRYRTATGTNVPNARSMSRADVAHAMLAALTDPATVRQALGVAT